MSKLFYDHLIVLDDIIIELDKYEIPRGEREKVLDTLDEIIHQYILDTILFHLPQQHHNQFLTDFTQSPHSPSILAFVKEKTRVDIEREIKKTVKSIKKKILQDIQESLD
jgi:hypothetical protein